MYNRLVLPYSEFENDIEYTHEMQFYVGKDVFWQKNIDEVLTLFNIYFDASATRENFKISEDPSYVFEEILDEKYDYVLLTQSDWQSIELNEEKLPEVLKNYVYIDNADTTFFLLIRR